MKNTKIVELIIENDSEALAIDAISLVSAPAIETDFVFFGKEKNNLTFAKVDEEKRMLVSPALIPNKQIFRYDANKDQEYYVYFSPATVQKASELYLKHNNHHKATYEHQDRVAGVLTIESWIIEDPKKDKSTLYGFNLPKGTWMVKMKIENDELWDKIKSGELKGLSIEGYFIDKMQKMSEKQPTDAEILTALNKIIREHGAKKVNLGLFDDADDLSKQAETIASDLMALNQKQIKISNTMKNEVRPKSKKLADDELKLRREVETREERLANFKKSYKAARQAEKDYNKIFKDQITENRKGLKAINKLLTKADKLGNKLDDKIVRLKKAGDELGVKVSTKMMEKRLQALLKAFKTVNSNIGGFNQQANI
jgi:hypothetical protein